MTQPPVREITAILVSWNDTGDLRAAIGSLAEARYRIPPGGPSVSLLVVDNGGGNREHREALSRFPGASLLVNEENRGFGPAANQAAEVASGDVLLFLNPDTRAEDDPFSEIARGFEMHPDAVALAPRLLDFDGDTRPGLRLVPPDREDQFTFQLRRLPSLGADARELLLVDHLLPNNRGRRRFRYADFDRAAPFEVEQAAAAALAVRTNVFRRIRGFDNRFVPAWFEDVDLCARLSREGKVLFWPEARFRHRGGVSSEVLGYTRFLPIYYRNALLYRRLHYGPLARFLYRPLLVAGMLLRLLALPLRAKIPRSRREAAHAYLSTLAVALGFPNRLVTRNSPFAIHNSP